MKKHEIDDGTIDDLKLVDCFLEECQKIDARIQAQTIRALIAAITECCDSPDGSKAILMGELRKKTKLSQASISRTCTLLGEVHRKGGPGAGLVVTNEFKLDRKHKEVRLTEKCFELLARFGDKRREIYGDGYGEGQPDNPWEGFGDPFEDDWDGPADELVEARLAWVAQMNGERW